MIGNSIIGFNAIEEGFIFRCPTITLHTIGTTIDKIIACAARKAIATGITKQNIITGLAKDFAIRIETGFITPFADIVILARAFYTHPIKHIILIPIIGPNAQTKGNCFTLKIDLLNINQQVIASATKRGWQEVNNQIGIAQLGVTAVGNCIAFIGCALFQHIESIDNGRRLTGREIVKLGFINFDFVNLEAFAAFIPIFGNVQITPAIAGIAVRTTPKNVIAAAAIQTVAISTTKQIVIAFAAFHEIIANATNNGLGENRAVATGLADGIAAPINIFIGVFIGCNFNPSVIETDCVNVPDDFDTKISTVGGSILVGNQIGRYKLLAFTQRYCVAGSCKADFTIFNRGIARITDNLELIISVQTGGSVSINATTSTALNSAFKIDPSNLRWSWCQY